LICLLKLSRKKYVDNRPKAPKTYTLYGFNYDQPENTEGLVKEVIETYERPIGKYNMILVTNCVVKEEKKEEPEIYESRDQYFYSNK
jgi:hypothetical protein